MAAVGCSSSNLLAAAQPWPSGGRVVVGDAAAEVALARRRRWSKITVLMAALQHTACFIDRSADRET
jgi:hypothetical protein